MERGGEGGKNWDDRKSRRYHKKENAKEKQKKIQELSLGTFKLTDYLSWAEEVLMWWLVKYHFEASHQQQFAEIRNIILSIINIGHPNSKLCLDY